MTPEQKEIAAKVFEREAKFLSDRADEIEPKLEKFHIAPQDYGANVAMAINHRGRAEALMREVESLRK